MNLEIVKQEPWIGRNYKGSSKYQPILDAIRALDVGDSVFINLDEFRELSGRVKNPSFEKKEMEEEAAEVEAEEKEMEEVAASEEPTATPVAKKVVESVSKETYFSAEERESLIAELKAQILAELSKEDEKEETTEEVELSKPIQHNPENAQPREQISFNKKEQSLKSMVYDLISK